MRFASLGSGSRGNALLVEVGDTRLLVDCGFSLREVRRRLARLSLVPDDISGILVTHEHSDHVAGVVRLAESCAIPVYLTHGTFTALSSSGRFGSSVSHRLIEGDHRFAIEAIEVMPFAVPHDAREPVQFVFSDGRARLGVLTDCGRITAHIAATLDACQAMVLECNHDADLLAVSSYHPMLKRRIAGDYGHLGNAQAAELLRQIDVSRLRHVVAAHLSEENNQPGLAMAALSGALGTDEIVAVASQTEGSDWREV